MISSFLLSPSPSVIMIGRQWRHDIAIDFWRCFHFRALIERCLIYQTFPHPKNVGEESRTFGSIGRSAISASIRVWNEGLRSGIFSGHSAAGSLDATAP